MKKILIIIFCICSTQLFSQTIIKKIGGTYCDCWDSYEDGTSLPGSSVWKQRYIISWDSPELIDSLKSHNDHFSRENFWTPWNTLEEVYYCGCYYGGGESILQSVSYYKHGKKHGTWIQYSVNGTVTQTIEYNMDSLIIKKRYNDDGSERNGEYVGKSYNTLFQQDIISYEEKYVNGVLIYGKYYKHIVFWGESEGDEEERKNKIIDDLRKRGVYFEKNNNGHLGPISGTFEDYVSSGLLELDYIYSIED